MHYHSFIPFQNTPEVGKNEVPTVDPIDTTAESATTESLVKGGSSGKDEGIGATVRDNDNAMIAIVNEPSNQAHAGGVSVSDDAISSKKKGTKRKASIEADKLLMSISEHAKNEPRIRKKPALYCTVHQSSPRRQKASPGEPVVDASQSPSKGPSTTKKPMDPSILQKASEENSEEESDKKSNSTDDANYNILFDEVTSDSNKTPSVSASDLQEDLANLANDVPQEVPIDVDEEDVPVPFDPIQFSKKDNIEQELVLESSTCVFNIHFLPLSFLVHSTDKYLFCKFVICFWKFSIFLIFSKLTNFDAIQLFGTFQHY
jgi:hypothetical protein